MNTYFVPIQLLNTPNLAKSPKQGIGNLETLCARQLISCLFYQLRVFTLIGYAHRYKEVQIHAIIKLTFPSSNRVLITFFCSATNRAFKIWAS